MKLPQEMKDAPVNIQQVCRYLACRKLYNHPELYYYKAMPMSQLYIFLGKKEYKCIRRKHNRLNKKFQKAGILF